MKFFNAYKHPASRGLRIRVLSVVFSNPFNCNLSNFSCLGHESTSIIGATLGYCGNVQELFGVVGRYIWWFSLFAKEAIVGEGTVGRSG